MLPSLTNPFTSESIALVMKTAPKNNSPAQKKVLQKLNKVSKNQVPLGWNDIRGGMYVSKRKDGDWMLEGCVQNLFTTVMYNEMMVPLEYKPVGSHNSCNAHNRTCKHRAWCGYITSILSIISCVRGPMNDQPLYVFLPAPRSFVALWIEAM